MKEQNLLCARSTKAGTLDIWVNPKDAMLGDNKLQVVVTYDGKPIETEQAYAFGLGDMNDDQVEKQLDWFMGMLSRDTQNWFLKDIVIHWGVHKWTFYNEHNVTTIEKDEYVKNLQDIEYYYEIDWKENK